MKKLLLLTMLLAAALCLTACDGEPAAQAPTQKPDTATEGAKPTEPTIPETEPTAPETQPHTHQWGAWMNTVNPTFTATGEAKRTCEECGETETKVLETLTIDEEMSRLADVATDLPEFNDVSELSAGSIFQWVSRAGKVSSEWNSETFQVTIVYSVDLMDAHTTAYLGKTFDYMPIVNNNDPMTYDAENNQIILVTGGSGGGPMAFLDAYEQIDDTHYRLRYYLKYEEEENPSSYGTLMLVKTENGFMFESHQKQ